MSRSGVNLLPCRQFASKHILFNREILPVPIVFGPLVALPGSPISSAPAPQASLLHRSGNHSLVRQTRPNCIHLKILVSGPNSNFPAPRRQPESADVSADLTQPNPRFLLQPTTGHGGKDFTPHVPYDEKIAFDIAIAASKMLNIPLADVLDAGA